MRFTADRARELLDARSSPRLRRYVLRSQAIPPFRDSDSPTPGRQRHRRGPGLAARAAAAARCRASPNVQLPAGSPTSRSPPGLRPGHPRRRATARHYPHHARSASRSPYRRRRPASLDGTFRLADLFVDPAQRAPRAVMPVLVVDDAVGDPAGLLGTGGRPRLGEHQPVRDRLAGVFVAPFAHDIGQLRDAGSEDEREPGGLQGDLVGLRDHAGIGNHCHVGELMRLLEGVDDRQHRGGLGFVALEGRNGQREPGRVGEQTQGDLRFQPAFLGEPGSRKPSPASVSKYSVETSKSTRLAGPNPACARMPQPAIAANRVGHSHVGDA